MDKRPDRLFLRCAGSSCFLQMAGEDWEKEFTRVADAIVYASSIIKEETSMSLIDERGVMVSERLVHPKV